MSERCYINPLNGFFIRKLLDSDDMCLSFVYAVLLDTRFPTVASLMGKGRIKRFLCYGTKIYVSRLSKGT